MMAARSFSLPILYSLTVLFDALNRWLHFIFSSSSSVLYPFGRLYGAGVLSIMRTIMSLMSPASSPVFIIAHLARAFLVSSN